MPKMIAESRPNAGLLNKGCRTFDIGIVGYEECLRAGPNPCRYALPFGYGFLYHHPRLSEMQAVSAQPASAGLRRSSTNQNN